MERGDLIFTVAVGERHSRMAYWMLRSVRRLGLFRGRLLAFSDYLTGVSDAEVIKLQPNLSSRDAMMGRFSLHTELPPCERMLYLDADTLCIAPVQPMFDEMHPARLMVVSEGEASIKENLCYAEAMTTEQYDQHGRQLAINTGIIGGYQQRYLDAATLVNRTVREVGSRCQFVDQPIVNLLYATGKLPVKFWERRFVSYPRQTCVDHRTGPGTIIEHHNPHTQPEMLVQRLAEICVESRP